MKWYYIVVGGIILWIMSGKQKPKSSSATNLNLPRGIRNNNPGNLIKGIKFSGEKIPSTDSRFAQFTDMPFGIRALFIDLINKHKRGLDTIEKILEVYAPRTENPTLKYISTLSAKTNIPATLIFTPNKENFWKLAQGIAEVENGTQAANLYIKNSDWVEGWRRMSTTRPDLVSYLK